MTWWAWTIIAILFAALYWQRRGVLFWAMESCLWIWVLKRVIRKLRLPWGDVQMTAAKFRAVQRTVRAGSILLGVKAGWLANRLTPGETSHGALCINDQQVAEMVGEGFRVVNLMDFVWHYSRVIVLSCMNWDEEYVADVVIPTCHKYEKVPYDHGFKPGARSLYCFELIEACDPDGRLHLQYESLFGRKLITGDSILTAPNVHVVCDTDNLPSLSIGV